MGMTDLITGGFGTLGQAAGQGVEGYRTERDWKNLQQANSGPVEQDPVVEQILALARQGVDPMQAAEMFRRQRGAAPQVNVPSLNQGSRVMNAVPMEPANPLGGLGAPPAAPSTPAQVAPAPQAAPGGPRILGGVSEMWGETQAAPLPQQAPAPQAAPPSAQAQAPAPQAPPQAAPLPAQRPGQANFMGLQGEITPRNFQLAQFLAQQRQQQRAGGLQAATQVASAAIKGRAGMEKEVIRANAAMEREAFKAEARANIVGGQLEARLKQFDVQNQTNIWRELQEINAKMAAIKQSDINSARRDSLIKAIYTQSSQILAKNAPFRGMDPALDATLDRMESIRDGIEIAEGVKTTMGPDVVTPAGPNVTVPGLGVEIPGTGTPEKRTPGKPKTTVTAPAGGQKAPAAADVLKKMRERSSSTQTKK